MFEKKSTDTGSNFWISYADLMAGLLFVFILLIGAIISKSIILKSDLHDKEDRLSLISQTLKAKESKLDEFSATLAKNKTLLGEKDKYLAKNKRDIENKKRDIENKKRDIENKKKDIENKKKLIDKKDKHIAENKKSLNLKDDEIKKLHKMLLDANTQQDLLSKKVVIVQNLLNETNTTLQKEKKTLHKTLKDYKGQVIVLSDQLTEVNKTVKHKDEKLLKLLNALDEKETKYDDLIVKLQSQKAKIKSLTGIKLKVVAALKEELGSKIAIDKQSGSLRLASNILFDRGRATLKEEAKIELKQAFEEYIGALVTNTKIKPHLDRIIIEGHTDSDGGYLYNLNLSQKRAFAVMNFLLSLDFAREHNIKPLMIASGRAYLDAIIVDGVEDKDASRRIEIKFRLKNEDAMHEIEKVLDAE
ncbi:OmpA family protein [Sulfurovum sp. CS9]|uniref:OmpA family protein n=1 Tax=Sulfurovum sp. CS9 TaxID=3391146 RepID=UPI0039EADB8E